MRLHSIFRLTTDPGSTGPPDARPSHKPLISELFRRRGEGSTEPQEDPVPAPSTAESTPARSRFSSLRSNFKALSLRRRAKAGITTSIDPAATLVSPPAAVHDSEQTSSGEPGQASGLETAPPVRSPVEQAGDALGQADRLRPRAPDNVERTASGVWEAASSTVDLWAGIVSKLGIFSRVVDGIGEVHPYLKAATAVINGITKPIVAQVARDEKFEELLEEMKLAYDHVIREPGAAALPNRKPDNRQTILLKDICRESKQCALFFQNEYTKTFWTRTARNAFYGDEVDEKIEQYKSSFARLRVRWQEEILLYLKGDAVLDKLSPMRHAGHSSQRACLSHTRVEVLNRIRDWIDDALSPRVLFLLGVAGSGKSTIAHSVAEIGHGRGILGSFFAFDRNDPTRVPGRLLGTIAHQLAKWNEAYRDWLVGILKTDTTLDDSPDIMKQWKRLIVDPAASIVPSGPVLVVIDAFDECPELSDDSRQRLLDCLTLHAAELPDRFRVLVTSRPLDKVSRAMNAHCVGRLDLADFSAHEDIYRYVRSRLPPHDEGGLNDWDCHAITRAADGLFQWAATACRFLASKLAGTTMSAKLRANLDRIVYGDPTQLPNGPPSLDALYAAVLDDTFDVSDPSVMKNFRSAVAMLLCAETAVSIDILQSIFERAQPSSSGAVQSVLGSMGVVLEGASSPSFPVRPMHLSFREFLLDASRSGPWHISGADSIAHGDRAFALGCLRIMGSDLTFNMHCLPSSGSLGRDLSCDPGPQTALSYSISTLDKHLSRVLKWGLGANNSDLFHSAMRRLLYDKLLFWIEWLLVRAEMDMRVLASVPLRIMGKMLSGEDRQFAQDALFFVQVLSDEHRNIHFPAHLYLSALPFAPADSLIRRRFIRHFPGISTVSPVLESSAWALSRVVQLNTPPLLAWSTDCRFIREDNYVGPSRCWDARTGDAVDMPLGIEWRYPSHESADGSVKVSLSTSRCEVHVHVDRKQINTTPDTFTISANLPDQYQADVSPDGKWIAILDVGRWRQWDLETGSEVHLPAQRCSARNAQQAATFSPDNHEIVCYAADDRTHRVYTIDVDYDPGPLDRDFESWKGSWINFKPQPRVDVDGNKFPDADLRCEEPLTWYPAPYHRLLWQTNMRLILGSKVLTFDMANARYGPEWAQCYAGTLEDEAIGDEYSGVDLEMEAS